MRTKLQEMCSQLPEPVMHNSINNIVGNPGLTNLVVHPRNIHSKFDAIHRAVQEKMCEAV